ncbi:hypothetical protein [Halomarina ordinaria]|uniref:Uncharacterized protein n=1 Tax=Halomarina ordinaria TaxID=3033939 RepID=A0ABD5U619_9EURY|nr:hypothetical protein [Halomarina sp. PSRA2]
MLYITAGLVEGLLALADERDPEGVTIGLLTTEAGALEGSVDLDPETQVFTHFYLPESAESVRAVFGVDLGTPRTQGRFVSHPDGYLGVRKSDDLHEVVFVAVPPWERVVPFGRDGRRRELVVLDAVPPTESVA